ncbi:hypothetical protein [Pollutibacter soli]|uniref:hypothetical protein n=1 Tax=Pollutibacter soli TaxID=3034157 RepID=UPI003013BCC1
MMIKFMMVFVFMLIGYLDSASDPCKQKQEVEIEKRIKGAAKEQMEKTLLLAENRFPFR